MAQPTREPVTHANYSAAVNPAAPLIVEEHPLFPPWLGAFEHLIKAHQRVKAAVVVGAVDAPELQKEFTTAKAAYLNLVNELD